MPEITGGSLGISQRVLETLLAILTRWWRYFGKCLNIGRDSLGFHWLSECGCVKMKNLREYAASSQKQNNLLSLSPTAHPH
jgi:hypothetical protein